MLVLFYPMKAAVRASRALLGLAIVLFLLLPAGRAMAQAQPVTINPTGGNLGGNDLRITITDTSVQVTHNGYDQYSTDPLLGRYERGGLRTYLVLQQKMGKLYTIEDIPQYLKHCEISEVKGDGTPANPWKVVAQSSIHNARGLEYFISTTYTYVAGARHYNIDFLVTSPERVYDGSMYGGAYWLHFYLSETAFNNGSMCGKGFVSGTTPSMMDEYYAFHHTTGPNINFYNTVGVTRAAGDCINPSLGSHVFKTQDCFSSFASRPFSSRDVKTGVGYTLSDMLVNTVNDMGIAVHKAVDLSIVALPTQILHVTKRFAVGFDAAEMAGVTVTDQPITLWNTTPPFFDPITHDRVTVNFASAAPEGLEGLTDHAITGLELKIGQGYFNLPQILEVVATPIPGPGNAVPGTDYEVIRKKIIIEPGIYWDSVMAIDNILIKGNNVVQADRKFRVEIKPLVCSPHLLIGTNNAVDYTIIDDDENRIYLEPDFTTVKEGGKVKMKVKMTGTGTLATPLVVNLVRTAAVAPTAELTDHSAIPATVTIPAGAWDTEFEITATGDRILENDELFKIEATAVFPTKTSTHDVTITITDTTGLNTDNRIITMSVPQGKEGETVTLKASLPDGVTTESPITITIDPLTGDINNTAELSDLSTAFPSTLTIPAGGSETTFNIDFYQDGIMEDWLEYWYFEGSASDHDGNFVLVNTGLVIEDSPDGRNVEVMLMSGSTANENETEVTVWFTLSDGVTLPAGKSLTFPIVIGAGSTADMNDISAVLPFEITINEYEGHGEYKFIVPTDPVWLEAYEELVITTAKVGFTAQPATLGIIDDTAQDPDNIAIIIEGPANVKEGTNATITARLAKPTLKHKGAVQVDLTFAGAAAASDYTFPDTKIIIPEGDNSATIELTAVTDAIVEGAEQLQITASALVAETPVTANMNIDIVDPPSTKIKFTATPLTLTEGSAGVTVTASLEYGTAAVDIPITLNIGTGSTADGDDFTTSPVTIKIPAGSSSVPFTLTATDDMLLEDTETLELSGTSAGYTFEGLTFTINDKQSADANNKKLTIQPQTPSVNENGDVTVWVRLPAGIKTSKAIPVTLARGSGSDADLLTSEYVLPASATIPVNGNEVSFVLHANTDNVIEADEILEIAGTATVFGTAQSPKGNVTIKDMSRTAANTTLVVSGPTEVAEGGVTANWRIELPAGVTTSVPITFNITPATVGNTTTGADFTGGYPTTATILKGQAFVLVPFIARADNSVEGLERLEMTLQSPDFTFNKGIGMNVKDTDPASYRIILSAAKTTLAEGESTLITATLDGFTSATAIDVVLNAGSGSVAVSPADYTALGTIHINANATSGTFTLQTNTDLLLEDDELLAIRGTAGTYTVQGQDVTIEDLTGTDANKTLSLTPATASVNEGNTVTMTVGLPAGIITTKDITVTLTKGAGSAATITASDYTLPASVVITAGTGSRTFVVGANTDALIESAELLEVTASGTVFGFASGDASGITINDATSKLITVTGAGTVDENNNITWRFALPSGVTAASDINIALAYDATSTATVADLNSLPALKIAAGQPFGEIIFAAKPDLLIEPAEILKLTPSATGGFTFSQPVSFTIVDKDLAAAGIQLSVTPSPIAEGAGTVIKAAFTGGIKSTGNVVITLAKGAASTLDNTEHGALGTITIAAGDSEGTFTLTTNNDLLLEPVETLVLTGTATGAIPVTGATLSVTDATGTVANRTLQISPLTATVSEGGKVVMTVGLPAGIITTQAITVTLSKGVGSAATLTSGDYTIPATVTIDAMTNSKTFDVDAVADGLIESAELLELRASAIVFSNNSTAISNITINDATSKLITVTGAGTVDENNNITWRFALPSGVTAASDINIALAYDATSTATLADLNSLPALKIAAGQPYGEIIFAAKPDLLIEPAEILKLTPSATGGFTFSQPVSFTIVDKDLAAAGIQLSVAPSPIAEGASTVIKAAFTGGIKSTGNVIVTLAKGAASTLDNTEHGALGTITIAAGDSEGTFTLTTSNDLLLESTETLVLTGTATGAIPVAGATLNVTDATGTVANRTLQISPLTATVLEGGKVVMTVGLPAGIITTQAITVTLSKGAGSAATLTSGDYTFPATVTIDAMSNSKTFDVDAVADGLIESAELLELRANATVFSNNSTAISNITITDVSNKHITVSGPATVAEGGNIKYTFSLPSGVTATSDINISLALAAASTAELADLTGLPVLKIAAGQSSGEITLAAKTDLSIEPVETLILTPGAAGFTFSQPVSFTITDSDLAAAGITLSATPVSINEGSSTVIKATLTGGVTSVSNITITLGKGGTSTLADTEHAALGTITIAAGATEGTFSLTTNTDQVLEPSETLVLTGTANPGIPVTGTTITVTDVTGTNANKTIQLTPANAAIVESGKVTMTVALPAGITTSQSITVTLTKGAGSAATLTTDDYSFPASVVIAAGTGSQTFDVTAVADALIESPELLELSATATVFGYTSSDVSNITITDVSNKHITVTGPATVTEGGTLTWRFSLPSGVTATSDINITLTADPASTASLADLTGVPVLKILAGEPYADITFTAKPDLLIELPETLVLNPSNVAGFTFSQPVTFTINDGDLAAAGITLSATPSGVAEGGSTVIKATLTGGVKAAADITVTLSKVSSSTLGDAEHGTLGTIVIPAGATEGTVTLATNTDLLLETTETLVLAGNATNAIPVTGTTITVTDATGTTANKTLLLTPATATVAEGGKVTMTVALPAGIITTQAITVTLGKGAGSSATLTSGDYSFPATVTIDANTNSKTFDVSALTDGNIEAAELLELTAAGTVFGHASSGISNITITDVSNKTITVSGPATVAEGGNIKYTFSLPSGVTAGSDINISLALAASSTADLADLTGLAALKIAAGQTSGEITFAAKADLQIEPAEILELVPSAAGFSFSQPVSFTITDGDLAAAGIQLTAAPASIAEGGSTVIKATLTGGVTSKNDITVTLVKDGASTLSNSEHGAPGTIVISAGDTEGTFTLTTNTDLLLEPSETLILNGTASPAIPVTATTITVTDATGSNANKTLQLSPATATIMEGGKVTMTISLPAGIQSSQAITVSLTRGAGTDAGLTAGEYSFPATVTIDPNTNSKTFEVTAIADANIETPELLELVANGTVFGFSSADKSNITITDVSNKYITVTGPAVATVAEGSGITYRFSLPSGVTATSDIAIALGVDASSTAGIADLTGIPVLKILAGQPYGEVTLTAKADQLIETDELLTLNPSATGFTFSQPVAFTITDGDLAGAGIKLSVAPVTIAEGGSTIVKAELTGGVTSATDIIVTLTKDGASTLADAEHGALGTITIPAGGTDATVTLSTNGDLLLEVAETLVLGGTANPNIPVTGATLTVTDVTGTNANKTLQLTPATATVAEGGKVTMTVALPANIITTQAITVSLSKGAGSNATITAADYSFPASVTIAANSNSATFEVNAETDGVIESNELLQITASATVFGYATSQSAGITITDVSNKLITVTGPATVTEGATVTWTFSLPAGVTSTQPVVINLAQGSAAPAAADDDLDGGFPASVTIPAGAGAVTLDIKTATDDKIESEETVELIPSAAGGFTFSKPVVVKIQDAPVTGNITMIASVSTIREGAAKTTITVSLPGAYIAGSNIVVNIAKNALSSAAGSDHTMLPATITIGAGKHSETFEIGAVTDNILEQLESLQLEGTATGFVVDGISISIEDATSLDPANTKISFLPAGAKITEGASGQFRLSLPAGITSSTNITVQLSKTDATSTAADTDHGAIPANVTIPALAAASADFTITASADGILEPVEVLQVGGIAPAGFSFNGGPVEIADGTGLIPANRVITITIDSTVLHEGSNTKVKFSLPAGITTAVPITISVGANGAQTASAADFFVAPLPVAIGAGQQEVTVLLTAIADMITEPAEVLQITATATGYTFSPATLITIPGEPAPGLSITAAKTVDASEPSTHGTFRIQLATGTAPSDITVNYTMGGTAAAGKDYTTLTSTAVIKAGDAGVNVTVNVLDDKILEGNETVTLTLVSGSFDHMGTTVPVSIATSGAQSMTLADDDMAIDRSILIEKIADASEPATSGRVRVRFANTDLTTVVPVNVSYNTTGTASAGSDYQVLTGSIDIPAGQKEAIIVIQPVNDNILEGTETVEIRLTAASAPLGSYTWPIAAQNTATVNLLDDDQIKMELAAPAEITEGGTLTVTLRSSEAFPAAIPVKIDLQHDAQRTVSTAIPKTGSILTVTMPANQTEVTFQLKSEENDTNDDDGFINLAIQPHTGAGQGYALGVADKSSTAVKDNDPLTIRFAVDSARVEEGNTGMTQLPFKVELSRKSTRPITLQYSFADAFEGQGADKDPMRAKATEDFLDATRQIIIAAGLQEAVIEVPVNGDAIVEKDEYFVVKLTGAVVASAQNVPAIGTAAVAVGVILNDDVIPDMEVRVHKGLSPNGDGKNDALVIENIEKYKRNELVIVNRWGGTIFQTTNYHNQNNAFKGIANKGGGNGTQLPDGSYFYMLQVWDADGKMTRYTGYIVLKSAQ
ncbi:Calx-beta domain-containing protein [Chitinophaga deserti]|uniref:Calx-beta domain-containing protein n=1 Tax=Chitinophaga deserti TaxID=2164099 RepID=UPI000D6DAFF3|nr:Calx-beta domain-containing protein [Chitinophaga deserti]